MVVKNRRSFVVGNGGVGYDELFGSTRIDHGLFGNADGKISKMRHERSYGCDGMRFVSVPNARAIQSFRFMVEALAIRCLTRLLSSERRWS